MHKCGVTSLISFIISKSSDTPASCAIAGKCRTVLVEQPIAISAISAFLKAAAVIIACGRISCSNRRITCMPACLASRRRPESTAATVPLPGKAIPKTSERQFMELAVNIPEQLPQVGQAFCSIASNSACVSLPAAKAPEASKLEFKSSVLPCSLPANIGPPLTKTQGKSRRAAAINMPGTILSQLGMKTNASKACASAIVSAESAISSRLAREYFMPTCPMAIPSQTAIAGNSNGVPPARRTPALTASAI